MQNNENKRHLLHLPRDFYFRLKVFGRGRTSYYAFIVPLNSPLNRVAHPVTVTMEKLPKCCCLLDYNTGIFNFLQKFVLEMSFRK